MVVNTNDNIYEYMKLRFKKLISMDHVRRYKLLEIIQYAFLYAIVTIPMTVFIENLFSDANPNESWWKIFLEVILQLIVIAIVVFYIQKIVKIVPFIFGNGTEYNKYRTFEYNGTITIGLIFVGTQTNLIDKIEILKDKIFDYIWGIKTVIPNN